MVAGRYQTLKRLRKDSAVEEEGASSSRQDPIRVDDDDEPVITNVIVSRNDSKINS